MKKEVENLLNWYDKNKREFPWRKDKDPYHVWISEIMLQQTRIEAVIEYYKRFLKEIPSISELSVIEEDKLLKLWEGLGYYSRARNLKKAAKKVMEEYHGVFPKEYKDIIELPGIGEYTAGAISSICFQKKEVCIDGNVMRVYARLNYSNIDVQDKKEKKKVAQEIKKILPKETGEFNQALMELGETICIPNGMPKCSICPLEEFCKAHKKGEESLIPEKKKKKEKEEEEYTVFLIQYKDLFAIKKRDSGLLKNMWEFPNKKGMLSIQEIKNVFSTQEVEKGVKTIHIFTHKKWKMDSFLIKTSKQNKEYTWVTLNDIEKEYALPTAFKPFFKYLKEKYPQ